MITNNLLPYRDTTSLQEVYIYQHKVGSLLYIITIIWPDAPYITAKLSELLWNLLSYYSTAIDHAIIYLYGMKNLAIKYSNTANHS